jgi:hypothetical protein
MASCARCGAALIATARFCAACGSPVARGASANENVARTPSATGTEKAAPAPAPVTGAPPSIPDPFAKTVLGDAASVAVPAAPQAAPAGPLPPIQPTQPMAPLVSPLASSVMEKPGGPQPPANVHVIATPWNVPPPSGPGPFVQQAPPSRGFGPGALVLVKWADGNRYPGTVLQVAGTQLLVSFPDGQQHWVDMKYVSPGA